MSPRRAAVPQPPQISTAALANASRSSALARVRFLAIVICARASCLVPRALCLVLFLQKGSVRVGKKEKGLDGGV